MLQQTPSSCLPSARVRWQSMQVQCNLHGELKVSRFVHTLQGRLQRRRGPKRHPFDRRMENAPPSCSVLYYCSGIKLNEAIFIQCRLYVSMSVSRLQSVGAHTACTACTYRATRKLTHAQSVEALLFSRRGTTEILEAVGQPVSFFFQFLFSFPDAGLPSFNSL